MKNKETGIFTLPNILTLYRLFLAPILYLALIEEMHTLAIFVFLLSGASDLADGFLARRLGEVSDIGKILDPIADKATYILALLGLIAHSPSLLLLLIALVIKEVLCATTSLISIHHSTHIAGARIHGKIAGCVLFCTVLLHLIFPPLPLFLSMITLSLSITTLSISCILYLKEHLSVFPRSKRNIVEDFIRRL